MCTIITYWNKREFVVGANRDEVFDRPSQNWKEREYIFCPLDVLKGTWIGVNKFGLFAGVVNLDEYIKIKGKKKTRGELVFDALRYKDASEAVNYLLIEKDPTAYKGCILLVGQRDILFAVTFNGYSIQSEQLKPGLHVVTEWGVDAWQIPRCEFIKDNYNGRDSLKNILSHHNQQNVEYEVCVHDPNETFQTRSSCIISQEERGTKFNIDYCNERPCQARKWNNKEINKY